VIIGNQELEQQVVTLRSQKGVDLGRFSIEELMSRFKQQIEGKT
jgi:threonyl-tRNA synthetase